MLQMKDTASMILLFMIFTSLSLISGDYHDRGSWKKTLNNKAEYFEKNTEERHNIEGI